VIAALVAAFARLPEPMRRSLTWDRGAEMTRHAEFSSVTGIPVYFADAYCPWQRGSNENTVSVEDGSVRALSQAGAGSSR
jgi:IS30 family transposase